MKSTEPTLVPKNPKETDMSKNWRVRFKFVHDGKLHVLSYKNGMNYITDYKERLAKGQAVIKALKLKLANGYNPVTKSYPLAVSVDQQLARLKESSFSEALDFAYNKKKADWSHKTKQDYTSVIKFLKEAALSLDLHSKKIAEFRISHYRLILEEAKAIRKLSAAGYNKYRTFFSSLVEELVSWEIVELNFVHHVKTKQAIKVFSHRPPTTDQRELIIGKIKTEHRAYYRFLCVLYGCTLRPKEITRLKIKDLHRKEQVFRIVPDKIEGNSKVNFEREVQVPDWVIGILSELNLHNFSPDDYIFAKGFLPGSVRMHSNRTTDTWKTIVKDGLGLDVNQYSLKKLSGNDMVKIQRIEGVDRLLELPQSQMGHTSTRQTETYVTEHKDIMRELVKTKMPVL